MSEYYLPYIVAGLVILTISLLQAKKEGVE